METSSSSSAYRPMTEKKPSQGKLKKSHVLQNVLKQIKEDTGKLWRSARSLASTDDEDHHHHPHHHTDHDEDHDHHASPPERHDHVSTITTGK